jgi:type II secretory pathway pseudopilin PulG
MVFVVVIISLVAGIAAPRLIGFEKRALQAAFIADLNTWAKAADAYFRDTGSYLEDSSSGQLPRGWEGYVDEDKWTSPTPVGGVWDMEYKSWGITSGFGVDYISGQTPREPEYFAEIDARFDDAELSTGVFQRIGEDRYYYVLEP